MKEIFIALAFVMCFRAVGVSFADDRLPILSPDGQKQILFKKSQKEIIPAVGDISDYSPEGRLADEL